MNMISPLFEGILIHLTSIDPDKDPEVESRWTHDPSFMRMMYDAPMRPLSEYKVRKKTEALEKEINESRSVYHFRIRTLASDRLVGFGELAHILWPTGSAQVRIGIGMAEDQRKGYGSEALALIIRFAFAELCLYRLNASIPEYNLAAAALFTKAGFTEEVRRRQALARDGRRWDACLYGLLSSDWKP
jgi:RimJ/RimL family protein N-acetyltransferase